MENSAEQGGGRRNPDGFRGRQRSYAKFYTTDVKGFYLRIVLKRVNKIFPHHQTSVARIALRRNGKRLTVHCQPFDSFSK